MEWMVPPVCAVAVLSLHQGAPPSVFFLCVSLAVVCCLNGMGNENKQPITELKHNTIFTTHMINNYSLRPKKNMDFQFP